MNSSKIYKQFFTLCAVLFYICLPAHLSAQTKKSFLKRAYINTVSRYNYFFNAKEQIKEVQRNAALAHKDDFNEIIHIFPFSTEENLKNNLPMMDEVIKRCNHIITRRQSSKWVDDSYLLAAKANFFKGDFFIALENFEFVASAYKTKPIRYEAEVWAIKTLLMLGKYDEAVALSEIMLADKDFPKYLLKDLNLVSAEGLIYQKKYVLAYDRMKKALPKVKRREYRYRKHFVAGQLAILNNNPKKAIAYFNKVTKTNAPYEFDFFSRINMVRMYAKPPLNTPNKSKTILNRMVKDDKNIDLLDQIFYELAMIELAGNETTLAMKHFKEALSAKTSNPALKTEIYLTLADLYFENNQFKLAQLYYDSAVQVLDPNNVEFESISNRHQVLTNLIENLIAVEYNDSMLRLARNPEFRKSTLAKIKEQERLKAEEEEYQKNNPFNNTQFMDAPGFANNPAKPGAIPGANFPFYDAQQRTKGINDFTMAWGGERKLGDFWRIAAIAQVEGESSKDDSQLEEMDDDDDSDSSANKLVSKKVFPPDIAEDDKSYFENVPFGSEQQIEAEYAMGQGYFLAGNIYREKLNQEAKAKQLLEEFLSKLKDNPFRENALYLLIKICESEGDVNKVRLYRSMLDNEFPNSDFALVLDNPELFKEGKTEKSPEQVVGDLYYVLYQNFQQKNYDSVILVYNYVKKEHPGNVLEGQFDFVYASVVIAKGNKKEYIEIMRNLAVNYAGTPLGELADLRVQAYGRIVEGSTSSAENSNKIVKILPYKKSDKNEVHHFIMQIDRSMDLNFVKIAFNDFNRDFRTDKGLQITTSFIGSNTRVLVITGFDNEKDVKSYIADAIINKDLKLSLKTEFSTQNLMYISKDNFTLLLKEKIWEDYQSYFIKNYL